MNVAANVPAAGSKYKLIDADTHMTEAHDLWVSRAPRKYRDVVPQVKIINDVPYWVIGGEKIIGGGDFAASTILKDGGKVRSFEQFTKLRIADCHPGAMQVKERLGFMDENGVWAQIVYPNILGFGGKNSEMIAPEIRLLAVQIFNDAMADLQKESGGRLCPMALLPWWDAKLAAGETRRIIDLGLRGVNINPTPHLHRDSNGARLPGLGHAYWNPFWDICNNTRLAVNFHVGSSEESTDWLGSHGWPELSLDAKWAIGGGLLFFENAQTLANLIFSGLLDRYENLQFVSVESGVGWIPYVLEVLDNGFAETAASKGLERRPSEYFPTNFHACFWFEKRNICDSIRKVGVDRCLFQTDFPHPVCLYPIDDIDQRLSEFSAGDRYKLMFGNSARVYSIPLPTM
jgi:predicted TIM-barrel fold metal-dependent hydrolase